MLPITREEIYLYKFAGNTIETPEPITRKELYLAKACGESVEIPEPITREETYLYKLAGADVEIPEPITTLECLMYAVCGGVIEIQPPVTHLEWFWYNILNTETTISGIPPVSFTSDGTALSSWIIYGNGQQTSTPTPDAPIMPTFCGVRTGNLFDITTLENGIYLASNGNKYGDATNGVRAGTKIKASPNTVYTLSAYSSANISLRILEWSNGTFTKQTPKYNMSGSVSLSVTTEADTTEIAFNIEGENGQYATNIMLNLGSTALPYEPFGWSEKITCAGQTSTVYLGQTQTVRRIKKFVFTGKEEWEFFSDVFGAWQFFINDISLGGVAQSSCMSNIATYGATAITRHNYDYGCYLVTAGNGVGFQMKGAKDTFTGISSWKSYLAAQYAAGTPVTVWYVLATPQTGIVNEPLAKIGDYADELHSEDAAVTIPTVKGENTLTVDAPITPSSVTITGHISQ